MGNGVVAGPNWQSQLRGEISGTRGDRITAEPAVVRNRRSRCLLMIGGAEYVESAELMEVRNRRSRLEIQGSDEISRTEARVVNMDVQTTLARYL
ncbi:MAG: hypothetical protein JWM11_2316 [Planctomycetaceae bacterium]|nr:hypothetical protein [Planctomycetaceae bacterium]